MSTDRVTEPERQVPVLSDVDVVVAGGGVAGVFAAMAAARTGAETVLVERFARPGGNIGPGAIVGGSLSGGEIRHLCGGYTGIPREFVERHVALGGGSLPESPNLGSLAPSPHPGDYLKDSNIAAHVLTEMLVESGVQCLLSTFVSDPMLEGNAVSGVFVENKSGRRAVRAKVVVDATGEADVAMRAGAPIIYPKDEYRDIDKHGPGGSGLYYAVAGVDAETYRAYAAEQERLGKAVRPAKVPSGGMIDGRRGPERAGHQDGRYGHDGVKLAADEIDQRRQIFEMVQAWKRELPGFENAYLLYMSPYQGSRGGPCIEGDYTVTPEDLQAGRRLPDVILIFGVRGWFGPLGALDWDDPRSREARVASPWTDLPYRALIPQGIEGMLAVGRCASGIPDTLLRARMMVMHMGQAGGTAAALAARAGLTPRQLDVTKLQQQLLNDGFHLGDTARLEELGLQAP